MAIVFTYEIPLNQLAAEIQVHKQRIEAGLNQAVDDILKYIENDQIKAYTATGLPPLPPGSDYVRTFTLQRASETRRTGTRLPDISGEWRINENIAKYGPYVVGTAQQQARIHRGRWKSKTQIEAEAKEAAPAIVERRLNQ